jgi:hypothetical protein
MLMSGLLPSYVSKQKEGCPIVHDKLVVKQKSGYTPAKNNVYTRNYYPGG